ncbi:hypothetical protein [Nocardia yamanashiensis]|uniref:hypothetical protein n=1 Tax=Nocardia yamanashiensis TaxID=209247 RepID=UPI0008309DCF|nr:hypothetical protein [Nocardia yamanashiensis]
MRKLLGAALVGGALTAATVAATGVAQATPAPPSPVCSLVAYPLVFLVEATGGQASPLLPVSQAISDAVCR